MPYRSLKEVGWGLEKRDRARDRNKLYEVRGNAGLDKLRRRVVITFPPEYPKKVLGLEFQLGTTTIRKITMAGPAA